MLPTIQAQDREISAMGGAIVNNDSQWAGGWQVDYSQIISKPFRFSVSLLNEGHFTGHHRDGLAGQVWAETRFSRFRLGVGIGPYFYFDTRGDDSISRGLGGIISLDGKYFVTDNWFLILRYNYVVARHMNSNMFFGGVGYNFDPDYKKPAAEEKKQSATRNEFALYLGKNILNNHDGTGFAGALEYRRNLSKYFDATLAYINESGERQGGAIQLWAVQSFFKDSLRIGIGAGVYEVYDRQLSEFATNGIISVGMGLRFYKNWDARLNFSRVIASRDRDADLVMAGIGFRF